MGWVACVKEEDVAEYCLRTKNALCMSVVERAADLEEEDLYVRRSSNGP